MEPRILKIDPYLTPFKEELQKRIDRYHQKRNELIIPEHKLSDFANGHEYFGIHPLEDGWVYREWAPGAESMFFTGDFAHWDIYAYPMENIGNGVFEIILKGRDTLKIGSEKRLISAEHLSDL
jgi:1,4-alpha-glucan branching enzyme